MPIVFQTQNSFTAGELSEKMDGRVDFAKYSSGLSTLENMIVLPQGGVTKRGGTKYINSGKTNTSKVRLVSFEFSVTQAYILEFGHQYIRFYKDQGIIESGGSPVEVATTYTEAELFDLQFTQSADTLYIVHKDHAPATLTRSSHTSWSLANISFTAAPAAWTTNNYPQVVTFYEQRLWFSATPNEPQTLWASKSGDYTNFTTGTADADSLDYTIATDQVNAIRWLSPGKVLMVGTAGGEFKVSASALDEAITPTNVRIIRESTYGSDFVAAERIGNSVLYIQRAGFSLRQLVYSFENDAYVSPELTLLADHVSDGGLTALDHSSNPHLMVWATRGDGQLVCLTFLQDQDVFAWHRHIIGGTSDAAGNDAIVESVAVIPGADGERYDEVWVSVLRYVNGAVARHIEVLQQGYDSADGLDKAFYVDSGLTYSGAATTTLSGLDHLEGETLQVLANGSTHPDVTVSSGSITLTRSVTEASVGYGYSAKLATMSLEGETTLGHKKNASLINFNLLNTLGLKVGKSFSDLDIIPFRSSADEMDESVGVFTGIKEIVFNGGFSKIVKIHVVHDQPLPLTILSLNAKVDVNMR